MQLLDWFIVIAYLVWIVWTGVRLARKRDTMEGYLLAGRSLPWWAVGLSVMATQMSAITLVGATGQAYGDGMRFIQFYFGLPIAMVILCITVVPFFHRAGVYTAYEYLERRFDARTRALAGFLFLLSRGLSCGVIIAAPATILSVALGWSPTITILSMGAVTTLFTVLGGVRAVTWNDVRQMVIVGVGLTAVVVTIILALPDDIGFSGALNIAGAAGRLKTVDFSANLNETYTFWSGLIGGVVLMLSYFGCDQSQVQRFLTARSVNEGRISLLMSAFLKIPLQFGILLIGTLVFAAYHFVDPPLLFRRDVAEQVAAGPRHAEWEQLQGRYRGVLAERRAAALRWAEHSEGSGSDEALASYRAAVGRFDSVRAHAVALAVSQTGEKEYRDVNYVFPTFILEQLPTGLVGLMIAAIFAAAICAVAAELNALATTSVVDFYRRFVRPDATEKQSLRVSRLATIFWGTVACIVATYAVNLGSLIEVVNKFGSYFYGSLLGVFALAIGVRRSNGRGAFWGLIAGMATVATVALLLPRLSFLWLNVVGCSAALLVGAVLMPWRNDPSTPSVRANP